MASSVGGCTCEVPRGKVHVVSPTGRNGFRVTLGRGDLPSRVSAAVRLGWRVVLEDRCWKCRHLPALPLGATCGDCSHITRCEAFGFNSSRQDRECSFLPARFHARDAAELLQRRTGVPNAGDQVLGRGEAITQVQP